MRPETQNGGAMRCRLCAKSVAASTSRLTSREPRRAVATQDSQFQIDAPAATQKARELRTMRQSSYCGLEIWDLEFPEVAGPASEARKGRERKTERTSRSCIVR